VRKQSKPITKQYVNGTPRTLELASDPFESVARSLVVANIQVVEKRFTAEHWDVKEG